VRSIIKYATLGWMHIPVRIPITSYPCEGNGVSYPLGGVFFLKPGRGSSHIRAWREKESAARNAILAAPSHGGSIADRLSLGRATGSARDASIRGEIEALVETGGCFELVTQNGMSTDDWERVFHNVVRTVEEFD